MEELARTLAELGIQAPQQQPDEGSAAELGDEKKKKKKEKKKGKAENEAPAEATNGAAAAAPAPEPEAAEEEEEAVPVDPAEVRFVRWGSQPDISGVFAFLLSRVKPFKLSPLLWSRLLVAFDCRGRFASHCSVYTQWPRGGC